MGDCRDALTINWRSRPARILPDPSPEAGPDVHILEAQLTGTPATSCAIGVRSLIGGDEYVTRIRASALDERIPIADCEPGEHFLFIGRSGRVSPCAFTTFDYGSTFGP